MARYFGTHLQAPVNDVHDRLVQLHVLDQQRVAVSVECEPVADVHRVREVHLGHLQLKG